MFSTLRRKSRLLKDLDDLGGGERGQRRGLEDNSISCDEGRSDFPDRDRDGKFHGVIRPTAPSGCLTV
jgi:hypothetical protein